MLNFKTRPRGTTTCRCARLRSILSGLLVAMLLAAPLARAQNVARPPVGGVRSPQGAMIFYSGHGADGACGPHCADWIAAEGEVEWDTFKRLFAFVDRLGGRKPPVVLDIWGAGSLNVAMSMGKIVRDRGLDTGAGITVVKDCIKTTDAACFALKRSGKPLDATIDVSVVDCDIVCVLVLAGGVHRTLPTDARVVIGPTHISNRLTPNVSDEAQKGLQVAFGEQYRNYLKQMGVSADIVDIMEQNSAANRKTRLSGADLQRLGIVTSPGR